MPEEIITIRDEPAPTGTLSDLMDLRKYGEILLKVVHIWKGVGALAVGAVLALATIKVHIGSGEYEWSMGQIKKIK